jgi:hypothetical protein
MLGCIINQNEMGGTSLGAWEDNVNLVVKHRRFADEMMYANLDKHEDERYSQRGVKTNDTYSYL